MSENDENMFDIEKMLYGNADETSDTPTNNVPVNLDLNVGPETDEEDEPLPEPTDSVPSEPETQEEVSPEVSIADFLNGTVSGEQKIVLDNYSDDMLSSLQQEIKTSKKKDHKNVIGNIALVLITCAIGVMVYIVSQYQFILSKNFVDNRADGIPSLGIYWVYNKDVGFPRSSQLKPGDRFVIGDTFAKLTVVSDGDICYVVSISNGEVTYTRNGVQSECVISEINYWESVNNENSSGT